MNTHQEENSIMSSIASPPNPGDSLVGDLIAETNSKLALDFNVTDSPEFAHDETCANSIQNINHFNHQVGSLPIELQTMIVGHFLPSPRIITLGPVVSRAIPNPANAPESGEQYALRTQLLSPPQYSTPLFVSKRFTVEYLKEYPISFANVFVTPIQYNQHRDILYFNLRESLEEFLNPVHWNGVKPSLPDHAVKSIAFNLFDYSHNPIARFLFHALRQFKTLQEIILINDSTDTRQSKEEHAELIISVLGKCYVSWKGIWDAIPGTSPRKPPFIMPEVHYLTKAQLIARTQGN